MDYNDKDRTIREVLRILNCPFRDLGGFDITESPGGNGHHMEYFCQRVDVCLCRMVFDDQKRFASDQRRIRESQGVLWSRKRIHDKDELLLEVLH